MLNFAPKKLYHSSLRAKVYLIFFVLIVIPLPIFTFYSTGRLRSVMQEQTLTVAQKTFNETLSSLNSLTAKMSNVSDIIANDRNVPYIITVENENRNVFHSYSKYLDVASTISKLKTLSEIPDIRLYSDSRFFTRPINIIQNTDWFADLSTFPSKQWFTPSDFSRDSLNGELCFSFIRMLHSQSNFRTYNGVLQISIPQSTFLKPMLETAITPNSTMLLLNTDEVLLTSNDVFPATDLVSIASIVSDPNNSWQIIDSQGGDYYVICDKLKLNDWILAMVIPKSDIAVASRLSWEMIGMMLVLASISYLIATGLANSILKRISLLTNATWQLESGDTDINLTSADQDELGMLMLRFDEMAACIDRLMEEKVQHGQRIKDLELQALQAQINPHFLYNTLDTINCLAIRKNAPEIIDLVSSLAGFYRISLSKGKEQITIRDEVTHAQMYLKILNSRFPNQIQAEWDIAPELENLHIIKIIMQPIIENAAIHGIFEREDGTGTLYIRGWVENEDVYITIKDDGVGMTQEAIEANFLPPFEQILSSQSGYGIHNISERIRTAYGAQYGLHCVSELNVGTTVTIHIPKVT